MVKCLILAAGKGTRLSKRGVSKPLISLLGLSLIERVIQIAHEVGITDFYVVTGYNGEKVRHYLDGIHQRENIKITHIINDEWEKENGVSVLKAKGILRENFILMMADHIFDASILMRLKDKQVTRNEVILAVDYNIKNNRWVDPEDVTKVLVENGRIKDIGKNIKTYNAYDTGVFLCSPAIFSAIDESLQGGDSSLSGGIKVLAERRNVKALDIKEGYWIDIDDKNALKKAERMLLGQLKKASDGPVSRYLNRPISVRITKYLLKTKITPNWISFLSFILTITGAIFFFLRGYANLVIGGILAQLSSIIDGCDGEIARLKLQTSDFGGWFDAVLDRYADAFLLFGLTYYVYFGNKSLLTLFIGFLAIIGTFMNSYTADKYDGLMKKKIPPGKPYFRMGRDVRMFIIFIGALINVPLLILVVIALVMNVENIRRVVVFYIDRLL
jgi:CDP-L-myo-inositol myo-inositolphosphotransferase